MGFKSELRALRRWMEMLTTRRHRQARESRSSGANERHGRQRLAGIQAAIAFGRTVAHFAKDSRQQRRRRMFREEFASVSEEFSLLRKERRRIAFARMKRRFKQLGVAA